MSNPAIGPDSVTARELRARQDLLQARAREILDDLDLVRVLGAIGDVRVVGSAVTGLMTWRDIDLDILCPDLDAGRVWGAFQPLAAHRRIRKLRWTNELGPFNRSGRPETDGYYLGIHYHEDGTLNSDMWKIDCWFLPMQAPRPDFLLIDRLRQELTDETRLAILWIKDAWHARPEYRDTVLSVDIYDAVLDHGVRSPEEFAGWLTSPGRR